MTANLFRRAALAATALAALAPAGAWANAFYLADHSAKGAGRAYSGEVADTGTDELWWNPSAIAGTKGFAADIDATLILPTAKVSDAGTVRSSQFYTGPVGGDAVIDNPIRNGAVPAGAIAYGLNDKVAVGLSVTAPYNFTTQYANSSWTRYSAERSALRTIDLQPTLAFELAPGLRLGVGWNIERVQATLSNAMPNVSPLMPDGMQVLHGTGWDMGVSIGGQWTIGPVTLGASYKSPIHHRLNGTLAVSGLLPPLSTSLPNGSYQAAATFSTPWMAVFGGRIAVTPRITLNGQITRMGWSEFDAISVASAISGAVPERYHNTWTYAGGVDFALSPATTLRAGIARDISPVRDDYRDARVPDSNRWVFALGGSHVFSKHITLDAGAQYLSLNDAPINRPTAFYPGSAAQTGVLTNGTMSKAHVVVLSLGGRFAF